MRIGTLGRGVGEVLLAAVLSVGLCLLVGLLAPLLTSLFAGGHFDFFARRMVFDRDGIPRIEVRELTYSHKQQTRQVTWYDLDGNKVGTYPEHQAPRQGFGAIVDLDLVLTSSWRGGRRGDLTGWRFLPPPGAEVPLWYKLPYRGLLAGYIYPYGRPIGQIGPDGFREPGESGPRFDNPRFIAAPGNLGQIWVDGNTLYSIDLEKMTCRRLWSSRSGRIRALGYFGRMAIVLCDNTLRVIDCDKFDLRTKLEGPMPPELRNNVAWQVAWVNNKLVIATLAQRETIVYHLGSDGRPLRTPWKFGTEPAQGMSRLRKIALTVASSITTPWVGMGLQYVLKYKFPDTFRILEQWLNWPYQPFFLSISLTITAISTFLTWWHLRLRTTPFQMLLGLFGTVLLGWPGHLVCRTLFDVSARVPCPVCGRSRTADRWTCPHCGSRWPAPDRTGCEILLPAPR
jgi:hypothetical protein